MSLTAERGILFLTHGVRKRSAKLSQGSPCHFRSKILLVVGEVKLNNLFVF